MSIHMNSDSTPVSGHLDIRHFSSRFTVRFLREEDILAVYDFCLGNPCSFCQFFLCEILSDSRMHNRTSEAPSRFRHVSHLNAGGMPFPLSVREERLPTRPLKIT